MLRGLVLLLILLGAGLAGCGKKPNPHTESIPKIPPGRAAVGPEQGQKLPVAPPGK